MISLEQSFLRLESVFRCLASNSLFSGALAALVGAIVGGCFVLAAQRSERRDATRGAARALALEMMGNYIMLRAFADSRRDPTFKKLDVSIPGLARQVYEQHLPRLAQEFTFDELSKIMYAYAVAGGTGSLLSDRLAKLPERLSLQDVEFLTTTSQFFLQGFKTVTRAKVLSRHERRSMERQVKDLPDVEQRLQGAVGKEP
jgi:hypothetical protein